MKFIDVLVKRSRFNGPNYRYKVLASNVRIVPIVTPCRALYKGHTVQLTGSVAPSRSVVAPTAQQKLFIGSGEDCFV
jgi:hypothetical protein